MTMIAEPDLTAAEKLMAEFDGAVSYNADALADINPMLKVSDVYSEDYLPAREELMVE